MTNIDKYFELKKLQRQHDFEIRKQLNEFAFERERFDRQTKIVAAKEYAREIVELKSQYDRHLKEYGQLAMRTIFLLNGGAIIALLTLMGSVIGRGNETIEVYPALFVPAFAKFGIGLVATVGTMVAAYTNYLGHHDSSANPADLANNIIHLQANWPGNFTNLRGKTITWGFRLAFVFGLISVLFFGWGCLNVAQVFREMVPQGHHAQLRLPLKQISSIRRAQ